MGTQAVTPEYAGTVAAIIVESRMVNDEAGTPPNVTLVAPVNPEPNIVIAWPPDFAPPEVARPEMLGVG